MRALRPPTHSSILNSETPTEGTGIERIREGPVYLQLLRLRHTAPVVFHAVVFLLLAHLVVGAAALFAPDEIYLYLYLGEEARESTRRFLNDAHPFLVYDPVLGWRNRPNVRHGKWMTDAHGARTTHKVGAASSRKRVVLFLGNSLINGGTHVSNQETLSAYIEDASTESINFATMLYSLDQVYLDYKERLGRYKADVVVVGLPAEPTAGLLNRYLPFRVRVESKMPFFKPRFEMNSGELSILSVPSLETYAGLFNRPGVLKPLEKTDAYYGRFSGYKRFGLMPASDFIYSVYEWIRNLVRSIRGDDEGMPLLKRLIYQMSLEARRRNAAVVFVALPDLKTVAPGVWQRYLPDRYGERMKDLKGEGYPILDLRPALRKSGLLPGALFEADGTHYSSAGNRIIAAEIKRVIDRLK